MKMRTKSVMWHSQPGRHECCSRMLPSFLVLGERKCGTTSYFNYILTHPFILPPKSKEPGYLSQWHLLPSCCTYAQFFPALDNFSASCMRRVELLRSGKVAETHALCTTRRIGVHYITGEATATTLTQANPSTVRSLVPHAKLIVLARCPVQRLFSHYCMYLRFKAEGRASYRDLETIEKIVASEVHLLQHCLTHSSPCNSGNLVSPGYYASWLKHWEITWSLAPILVLFTEELAEASRSSSLGLKTYLRASFHHIGVDPDRLNTSVLNTARSNVAATVTELPVGVDNRTMHTVAQMVCPLFSRWNLELATWVERPVPSSWMCHTHGPIRSLPRLQSPWFG